MNRIELIKDMNFMISYLDNKQIRKIHDYIFEMIDK